MTDELIPSEALPVDENTAEIWSMILGIIREKVNGNAYSLWFHELILRQLIDDHAYLQTTNNYKRKYLLLHFFDLINDTFREVCGFPVKVEIISIETASFEEQFYELAEEASKAILKEQASAAVTSAVPPVTPVAPTTSAVPEAPVDSNSSENTAGTVNTVPVNVFDDEEFDEEEDVRREELPIRIRKTTSSGKYHTGNKEAEIRQALAKDAPPAWGDPDYREPEKVPVLIKPNVKQRRFKLKGDNLNFPKAYNPESGTVVDVPLSEYMDTLSENTGDLEVSESTPDYKPSYTFDNFVVGTSNNMAYAVCRAVAQNPGGQYNPLFLYGPPGIGKTHLLYAIAQYVEMTRPSYKIVYCTSEDFMNQLWEAVTNKTTDKFQKKYRGADILMIDDIQFLSGKEATQLEFFNTFNTLFSAGKHIIMASDRPPKDIPDLEARIRSRLEGSAMVDIGYPDSELRSAIIKRKAQEMHVSIPNTVITYISDNVRDNVRQIEGILKHLSIYAILNKAPISEDIVQKVVGNVASGPVLITTDKIVLTVCRYCEIKKEDLLSTRRSQNIAVARHITAYLLRRLTSMTLQEIGLFLGRHHSTVKDSIEYVEEHIKEDSTLSEQIKAITRDIQSVEKK